MRQSDTDVCEVYRQVFSGVNVALIGPDLDARCRQAQADVDVSLLVGRENN